MAYQDYFNNYLSELVKGTGEEYTRSFIKAGLYNIAFPERETAELTTRNYFQTERLTDKILNNVFNIDNKRTYQRGSLLVMKYNTYRDSFDLFLKTGNIKDLEVQTTSPFGALINESPESGGPNSIDFKLYLQTCSINVSNSIRVVNTTPKGFEGFISEIVGVNGYDISLDIKLYDNFYTKPVQFMSDVLTMLDKKIITLVHPSLEGLGANKFVVRGFTVNNQLGVKNCYSFTVDLISYDNGFTDIF